MKTTFTAADALLVFWFHAQYEFHSALPIRLLEKRGVKNLPSELKQPVYDVAAWPQLWEDMMELATTKARQDHELPLPEFDGTVPLMRSHVLKMAKEDGMDTKPKTHAKAEANNRVVQEGRVYAFYSSCKDVGFGWLAANPNGTTSELVDVLLAEHNPFLLIDVISRAAAQRAAERVFAVRAGV